MPLTSFAPLSNEQVINPWTAQVIYGPVTYQTMSTADAGLEKAIVERVASYGRQLGRISEALRVLAKAALPHVGEADTTVLREFLDMVDKIDAAKARYVGSDSAALERLERSLAYLEANDDPAYQKLRLRLQRLLRLG